MHVCVCVCVCVRACVSACVRVHACACVRLCTLTTNENDKLVCSKSYTFDFKFRKQTVNRHDTWPTVATKTLWLLLTNVCYGK